jgi:serine protease AprX
MGKLIVVVFLVFLNYLAAYAGTTEQEESTAVTLTTDRPALFVAPDGTDVFLAPGMYEVEPSGQDHLKLLPVDPQGQAEGAALVIQASLITHKETQHLPAALSFPGEKEDTHHFVLLLPDGQGVQAIGTYSGVRPRGVEQVQPTPLQLSAQMQLVPQRAARPAVNLRETEDPYHEIYEASFVNGQVTRFSVTPIPKQAFAQEPVPTEAAQPVRPAPPGEKIHPLVKGWLGKRPGQERELVVVRFQDNLTIPRFPEPAMGEPRDSPTNKKAQNRAKELIQGLRAQRGPGHQKLAQELAAAHGAQVRYSFWLTNAMLVDLPLGAVNALANRPDVLYVEPHQTLDTPPQNSNPNDDVDDGRARLGSDRYFNLTLNSSTNWIGLLDTGVRFTHTQFTNPNHIDFQYDCVNGGADCNDTAAANFNATDDCWNHGTSSAGIITGNATQGNQYRGVTAITLDSLKVYPAGVRNPQTNLCTGGLNTTAAVLGFERAVEIGDRVIVAEMQGSGNSSSAISAAADAAFDTGAVIIAANGNFGPGERSVRAPANAHKVIGVGAFDVQTLEQYAYQSEGPTEDDRIKPDIQAPTNTETASNVSNTALKVFGGTSGATPYAGGAAALLRNFMRGTSLTIDPGHVYARLILSGQQPFPFNNTSGAGRLRLPTDGLNWWGKTFVSRVPPVATTVDIPINAPNAITTLDAAAWWPESASQSHAGIYLYLIDPSGTIRATSDNGSSVFQRVRVSSPTYLPTGIWKIRIRSGSGLFLNKPVYWSASSFSTIVVRP